MQPLWQKVNAIMMTKKGVFSVCLMLPVLCIIYNVWNFFFISLNNIIISRAFYQCFFTLNEAVNRVMWYAVPEHVKALSYAIVNDIVPAAAMGAGAFFTLGLQEAGVAANDGALTGFMVLGSVVWIIAMHFKCKKGYQIHLAASISKRSLGSGEFVLDANNQFIVDYVTDFLMLGDTPQRIFILNLLKGVPLEPFAEPLRQLFHLRSELAITVAVVEVSKTDYDVISDLELQMLISDRASEDHRVVGAAVLACGARRMREAKDRCEVLLESKHHGIRLNAAVALLNMRVEEDVTAKIKAKLTHELSVDRPSEMRRVTLQALSNALYERPRVETENFNVASGKGGSGSDGSNEPRQRSRAIKRLGLDYILPMVAQSLTDIGTSQEAADVLNKFDSTEVQFLFQKILQADEDGLFFVKPVFEYLAENSARTSSNVIITTLLDLPVLKQPDMLGKPVAALFFRTIIAVAKNAPCSVMQEAEIKEMLEEEIKRTYRKISVLFWMQQVRAVLSMLSIGRAPSHPPAHNHQNPREASS